MHPKMTVKYAAEFLGIDVKTIRKKLANSSIKLNSSQAPTFFGNKEAQKIFNLKTTPKIITFQIVKGGTGKTSLAASVAIRASLFGLKVLCIDLDQQANLTQTFNVDSKDFPVMIDLLAEGYPYRSAITQVYPGLDLIGSRIENALLDEVITLKKVPLNKVYFDPFTKLKQQYDLIVIDCPPNIGKSVAATTLASDLIVAPVLADSFALSGLEIINNTIQELQQAYKTKIDFKIVLNKYDTRTNLAKDTLELLKDNEGYAPHLLNTVIRMAQEFPNSVINHESIYDNVNPSPAKDDIDLLTKELLGIYPPNSAVTNVTSIISNHVDALTSKKVKYKVKANSDDATV